MDSGLQNPVPQEDLQQELRLTRTVFALATILYPGWYFIFRMALPEAEDDLGGRFALGTLTALLFTLTYVPRIAPHSYRLMVAATCVLGAHYAYLVYLHAPRFPIYAVNAFVTLTAVNATFHTRGAFLLFNALFLTAVSTALYFGPAPGVPTPLLVAGLATVSLVKLIIMNIRLQVTVQLRQTESELRIMADTVPVLLWVADLDGRPTFVNRSWLKFHGVEDATRAPWWRNAHPEDLGKCEDAYRRCAKERQSLTLDLRMRRSDGVYRDFIVRANLIVDGDGTALGFVGSCLDVTERSEFERERELNRAQMQASERLSALGEMAGGIAHEINNPLAIITGRAAQLQRLLNGESFSSRAKALSHVADIGVTANRIAGIVRGMRSLSRDASKDPMTEVPLAVVLNDALGVCTEKARHRGVELSVAPFDESIKLRCRQAQISQVLLNLLNNSLDAVEALPERRVTVRCQATDRWVDIEIQDSGPGVPTAIREKIFQPFFTTKPLGQGTGLGLSISRRIVDDHGGVLRLRAESGQTVFVVRLPRATASPLMKTAA